jgi:predicted transcriptional regulator
VISYRRLAVLLFADGMTTAQVAWVLGLSEHTVAHYCKEARAAYRAAGLPVRSKLDLRRELVADGQLTEQDRAHHDR